MLGGQMSFRAAAQRRRRPQAAIATGGVGSTLAVNGRFYRILTFTASGMLTLVQGGRIEYLKHSASFHLTG